MSEDTKAAAGADQTTADATAAAGTNSDAAATTGKTDAGTGDSSTDTTTTAAAATATETAKAGPPDKYDLTLPDGVAIEAGRLKALEAVARGAGWTNAELQNYVTAQVAAQVEQSRIWIEELENHPEYGGDKLEQTETRMARALDRIAPKGTPKGDAFRHLLLSSGAVDNVAVVGVLADLGALLEEDTHVSGTSRGAGAQRKSPEEVLYGGKS
jgi:hypothetical protein